MYTWYTGGFIVLLLASVIALPASAAHNYTDFCGLRADMVREMEEDYGEAQTDVALERTGLALEVFQGQKDGAPPTWTIILTRPDGTSCVIAAGEDWQHSHDVKKLPLGRETRVGGWNF